MGRRCRGGRLGGEQVGTHLGERRRRDVECIAVVRRQGLDVCTTCSRQGPSTMPDQLSHTIDHRAGVAEAGQVVQHAELQPELAQGPGALALRATSTSPAGRRPTR